MKAMEKKATPMPEELEREWNEVRVCFRLLQCRRARIVTKRMPDGSVKRYDLTSFTWGTFFAVISKDLYLMILDRTSYRIQIVHIIFNMLFFCQHSDNRTHFCHAIGLLETTVKML